MNTFDDACIETPRLLLRQPRREDFEAWAALGADEVVMRSLGGVQPRAVAWRNFLFVVGGWHIQGFSPFSVIEKASGRWIGRVGPLYPEGWPGTEVGWTLAHSAWGNGYALEAARASIDWAFERLAWEEVIHCIAPDNPASRRVAERLGATRLREATMPPPFDTTTVEIWGQSRQSWRSRREGEGK